MNLWLDDIRRPPSVAWTWATTVEQAKRYLQTGRVEQASLDHDLGACGACHARWMDGDLAPRLGKEMPHCEHYGTGWTLVKWMAETGHWPKQKPTVHSANEAGRTRMRDFIDRYFGQTTGPMTPEGAV